MTRPVTLFPDNGPIFPLKPSAKKPDRLATTASNFAAGATTLK
jgi:hypothetical protein